MKTLRTKRLIRNFVKSINSNIKVTFNRKGIIASDILNNRIYLDINECLTNDYQELQKHINRQYNFKREVGLLPFIVLHEVGHIQTAKSLDNVTDELLSYGISVRKLQESDMRVKSINKSYSKLKLERLANHWAFEYAKSCNSQVIEFKNNLQKLGY